MERDPAPIQSKKEEEASGRRWVRKGGGARAASKGRTAGSWLDPRWPWRRRVFLNLRVTEVWDCL